MFDDINKAGKMLQERIGAVPPKQIGLILNNVEMLTTAANQILSKLRDGETLEISIRIRKESA